MPEPRAAGRRNRQAAARSTAPRVGDVVAALDEIAPFAHAADWDNVSLLAGRSDWPGASWLVTLDLTDAVAREALRREVDGVVAYHPPIFKGVRKLTDAADGPTSLLPDLLAQRIAIVATHTAFDAAVGGTNDLLLAAFDVEDVRPLETSAAQGRSFKLVVFTPPAEVEPLRAALSAAGAGVIGEYDQCSYELSGRGTFRASPRANPVIGRRGRLEVVDEVRLEMVVPADRLDAVVRALYATHSYEEPAFDVYPLHELHGRGRVGMGRVGALRRPTSGSALMRALGRVADLSAASVVGELRRSFT
ncbi:MAG: Nif3-like dinuclear metal center hexameric protein, partial [Planctomycetota bacterium]